MSRPSPGEADARSRERAAARRAFIRAAHPDAGGDPDRFIAGLAEFDRGLPTAPGSTTAGSTTAGAPRRPGVPDVYRSRRPDRLVRQGLRALHRRLRGMPARRLR